MKLLILYRDRSDHARPVITFMHDFSRQYTQVPIETREVDSREGAMTAETYGVMAYPAFIVLEDGGAAVQVWQGSTLPLMGEVAAYAR